MVDNSENVLTNGDSRKAKQQMFYSLAPTLIIHGDNLGITTGNLGENNGTYAINAQGLSKNVMRLAQKLRITK